MTSTHSHEQSNRAVDIVDEGVDYYKLLGVPYNATRAEITRAYREVMKRAHPDRHPPLDRVTADEHAKLLNRAFNTLSRAESRRTYDASIKAQAVQDQIMSQYFGGFGMPGSADPFGQRLRREQTAAERRDQERDDRNAIISILLVFAGATIGVIALLVLWATLSALLGVVF